MKYTKYLGHVLLITILGITPLSTAMWSKTKKKARSIKRVVANTCQSAALILTGQVSVDEIKNFVTYRVPSADSEADTSSECEPFDFVSLPGDIQQEIITQLSLYVSAPTINESIKSLLNLCSVSTGFYNLIKRSPFTMQIIKYLSDRFAVDPNMIAKQLKVID